MNFCPRAFDGIMGLKRGEQKEYLFTPGPSWTQAWSGYGANLIHGVGQSHNEAEIQSISFCIVERNPL